jgi:hypothetical protein
MNDSLSRHPVYAIAATVLRRRFLKIPTEQSEAKDRAFVQVFCWLGVFYLMSSPSLSSGFKPVMVAGW